jgi:hypothetical protein
MHNSPCHLLRFHIHKNYLNVNESFPDTLYITTPALIRRLKISRNSFHCFKYSTNISHTETTTNAWLCDDLGRITVLEWKSQVLFETTTGPGSCYASISSKNKWHSAINILKAYWDVISGCQSIGSCFLYIGKPTAPPIELERFK